MVHCIICKLLVPLSDTTAGSLYADGSQAFACNKHITEHVRWTIDWAAFDIEQYAASENVGGQTI
ncbi:MAG TPA: hypothetical protein VLE73_02400 [Candidatus Saccharimonadales bacterium]|nr:hypothetical protein [Candidatus Saccharimonadales bacterium]